MLWQYIIPAICTVIVAIIEALAQKDRRAAARDREIAMEEQQKIEHNAKVRARESRLSMDMMAANSELCDVICIAVAGGKINGNVERAREKAKEAREAYDAFIREVSAGVIVK